MENDLPVAAAEPTLNPTAVSADAKPVVAEPEAEVAKPVETDKPELSAEAREAQALKRRIDRLTREKYQTRAELEQLRNQQVRPDVQPQEPNTPTRDDIQRQAREAVEAERFVAKCNDVATTGAKKFTDFDQKLIELRSEVELFKPDGKPEPVMEAILDSDDPAALIHHLGSNPDVAAELAALSPRQQVRKLALIEHDLGEKPTIKPSNAPKPLQPVKSVAAGGSPDPSKDPEGWVKWRNAQVREAK